MAKHKVELRFEVTVELVDGEKCDLSEIAEAIIEEQLSGISVYPPDEAGEESVYDLADAKWIDDSGRWQ